MPADTDDFFDLMEWRERKSAEGALGRLRVLTNRVRHASPFWRLTHRF